MENITGNCLLSSGFLAYCGFYDQHYRSVLLKQWQEFLSSMDVKFQTDIKITDYLSTHSERLTWCANSLPVDDIAIENAVLLHRFNRISSYYRSFGTSLRLFNESIFLPKDHEDFIHQCFLSKGSRSRSTVWYTSFGWRYRIHKSYSNPVLNREIRKCHGRILIRYYLNLKYRRGYSFYHLLELIVM